MSTSTPNPADAHPEWSTNWSDANSPTKWDNAATQYNDAVGRSSRIGAAHLLTLAESLHPFTVPHARAIDLGAGTGSLTHQLAARAPTLPILATDISAGMLDQLMALRPDPGDSNVTSKVVDMSQPLSEAPELEGGFTHVFSTMAIQALPPTTLPGLLAQWKRLLSPDGILAIALWDFDTDCGPHAIWARSAARVDPTYVNPPMLPPGHWTGLAQLERAVREAGFGDVKAERREMGFDVGKEGFLRFFWESGNPMPEDRKEGFEGGRLEEVRREMERVLEEGYRGGREISLGAALVVGRKGE